MSELCEWKVKYSDTKRWKECEAQTAFDDRFCPIHQEIAEANEIDHALPLAQIAESLKELIDAMKEERLFIGPLDSSGSHSVVITEGGEK